MRYCQYQNVVLFVEIIDTASVESTDLMGQNRVLLSEEFTNRAKPVRRQIAFP